MPTQTNPLFLLYAVIVAQFGHLLFVLLRRPLGRALWRYCLLGLAVVMTVMVTEFMLTWSGYLAEVPWLMGVSFSLPYLLGPLILGSLHYQKGKPWHSSHLLHLLPFLAILFWQLPFLLQGSSSKAVLYETEIATESYFHEWRYIRSVGLKVLHLGVYLIIGRYSFNLKEKIGRGLMVAATSFVLLWVIHALLLTLKLPGYAITYCTFMAVCGGVAIWLTYQLLTRPVIVAVSPAPLTIIAPAAPPKPPSPKYEKSGIDEQTLMEGARKLETLMGEHQLYLNPDIRLRDLAEALSLPEHHLSQLLNAQLGMKFHDYINGQRVGHAEQLLKNEPDDMTMLAIAYAAGFNSKNSFNRAFRKFTGLNPTAYRKTRVIRPDGAPE